MRKILVIAFFFMFQTFIYGQKFEINSFMPAINITTEENFSFNKTPVYSIPDFGLALKSGLFNFRVNYKDQKWNSGIFLDFSAINKNFPFSFAAGNLSISGLVNKCSNPELSASISPFFTSSVQSSLISTLPSSTTSNKKLNLVSSVKINLPEYKLNNLQFNFLFQHNYENNINSYNFSSDLIIKPRKNLLFIPVFVFQLSPVNLQNNTSWYMENPYYMGYTCNSIFQLQTIFTPKNSSISKIILNTDLMSFYNNLNGINIAAINQFSISQKKWIFSNDIFLNLNENMMTSSGKTVSPQIQIKSGFSYKNLIPVFNNPLFYKMGFSTYYSHNFSSNDSTIKESLALSVLNNSNLFKIQLNFKQLIENQIFNFDYFSPSFQANFYNDLFNFSVDFSTGFNFSNSFINEKLDFKIYFHKKISFTNKYSIEFQEKNGSLYKIDLSTSISSTFRLKKISCTGKLNAAYTINF